MYAEKEADKITVAADDISDIDLQEGKLTYCVNDRQKTARFSKTPYVIYNGVGLSDYRKSDLDVYKRQVYGRLRLRTLPRANTLSRR